VARLGALLHAARSNAAENVTATRVIFFIFNPIRVSQKILTTKESDPSYPR
jgi:hypothetical protein